MPVDVSVAVLSVVDPVTSRTLPDGLAVPEAAFTVALTVAAVP